MCPPTSGGTYLFLFLSPLGTNSPHPAVEHHKQDYISAITSGEEVEAARGDDISHSGD